MGFMGNFSDGLKKFIQRFLIGETIQINTNINTNINKDTKDEQGKKIIISSSSDVILLNKLKENGINTIEDLDAHFLDLKLRNSIKEQGVIFVGNTNNFANSQNKLLDAKESIKIIVYYGDGILSYLRTKISNVITKNNIKVKLLLAGNYTVLKEVLEAEKIEDKIEKIIEKNDEKLIKKLEIVYYEKKDETPSAEIIKAVEKELKITFKVKKEIKDSYRVNKSKVRKNINEIKELIEDNQDKIEIRKFNTQVRYSITIIDDKWAWWTPYHPGIRTEDSISFELENKGKGSLFDLCNRHFDNLWYNCRNSKWKPND
jgi:hypothetical protein